LAEKPETVEKKECDERDKVQVGTGVVKKKRKKYPRREKWGY